MTFSRRIELRLKETNRSEQAAAFVELAQLRSLLDMLIKPLDGSSSRPADEIEALLRERRAHSQFNRHGPGTTDPSAFLTSLGSGHQALIADFEDIVTNIGEIALALQRNMHGRDPMSDTREDLLRLCSGPVEGAFPPIPVAGSLDDLEPVGELSESYAHPDFSDTRSKSTRFLRE